MRPRPCAAWSRSAGPGPRSARRTSSGPRRRDSCSPSASGRSATQVTQGFSLSSPRAPRPARQRLRKADLQPGDTRAPRDGLPFQALRPVVGRALAAVASSSSYGKCRRHGWQKIRRISYDETLFDFALCELVPSKLRPV